MGPSGRRQRLVRAIGATGALAALVGAGTALGACSSDPPAKPSPTAQAGAACGGSAPKLTVAGDGTATGTPDTLTLTVAVNVTDPTAAASLADDNTRATALTAVLEQGGVASSDIQTSNLSVMAQYNSHGYITGYGVSNTITAKLHDFSTAGSVIDNVVSAAGNAAQIQSLTFSVEDPTTLEAQARADAVHQAVSYAQSEAASAGEKLGPICSLSDESQDGYVSNAQGDVAAGTAAPAASVPLEPGSQQATADVSIVYALVVPARGV